MENLAQRKMEKFPNQKQNRIINLKISQKRQECLNKTMPEYQKTLPKFANKILPVMCQTDRLLILGSVVPVM